jgi:hypothetical protein
MNDSAWEVIIDKCPHCNNYISLHHRSKISERHLLELIFRDLIYHRYNECLDNIQGLKSINAEIEVESKSQYATSYKYKFAKIVI